MEDPFPNDWDLYMDPDLGEETFTRASERTAPRARRTSAPLQHALPDTEPQPTALASQSYLRLKLENLLLSPKTRKSLAAQGVHTLRQLCRLSPTRLASLPGLGTHSLSELGETLDYYGLSLAPEPPVRSSGKKRIETGQLCLPGMGPSEIMRVCLVCGQALSVEPASERFCSPACRQAARPSKKPQADTLPSPLPHQLAFSLLTKETASDHVM